MTAWCRRLLVGCAIAALSTITADVPTSAASESFVAPEGFVHPWGAGNPPLVGDDDGDGDASPPPSTVFDNEFIPRDANLSDCISGVQRPDCGSSAKGGWRQGLVFAAVISGMAFVGWRIIRAVRSKPPDRALSKGQNG